MRTLLVTGGAGFIGGNFIRHLLAQEPDVRIINVDALTYSGNLGSLADCLSSPRHVFVRGNIVNSELLLFLVQHYDVEGILNFAAETHVDRSIMSPGIFTETNVYGTQTLLEIARETGLRRFLQVSTDEVYGALGPSGLFREDTPLMPSSPYSASKAAADHLVHAYHHTYGLDAVITRCSNNYGPYQFPEKMVPLMIYNALQRKPLPVYGDGLHVRDWLFVEDHCRALWMVYEKGRAGEAYNIGGNNEKSNIDVVRLILQQLDAPDSLIQYVRDRPGHDRRYAIDASKLEHEIGWKPLVAFDDGIAETVTWYRTHEDWLEAVVSGEYQEYYQRMYGER